MSFDYSSAAKGYKSSAESNQGNQQQGQQQQLGGQDQAPETTPIFSRIAKATGKAALGFAKFAGQWSKDTAFGYQTDVLGNKVQMPGVLELSGNPLLTLGVKAARSTDVGKQIESNIDTALKPEGTAEKVGYAGGMLAEAFMPSGGAAELKAATNLPKVASFAEKAIDLAKRSTPYLEKAAEDATQTLAMDTRQRKQFDAQSLKSAGATTLFSLAAGPIAKATEGLSSAIASRVVPTTIKEAGSDIQRELDIGKAVKETGVSLTRKGVENKLAERVRALGSTVDSMVDNFVQANPGKIGVRDIANDVLRNLDEGKVIRDLELLPTDYEPVRTAMTKQIEAIIEKYPDDLDVNAIQKLKKELGPGLEKAYKSVLERPIKVDKYAAMSFQQRLRQLVEEAVPEVKPINKKMSEFITARDRMASKGSYSGYLTDIMVGALSAGNVGDIIEDPAGYIKRGATAILLKRLGTSTLSKTASAQILDGVAKVLENPATYRAILSLFNANQLNKTPEEQPQQ